MITDPQLSSDKVKLRPWHVGESDILAQLVRDDAIGRWTPIPPNLTSEQARDWILRRADRQLAGAGIALAVIPVGHQRPLGTVGLGRSSTAAQAELYYWLGVDARGRGLAREAVSLICSWAWGAMDLDRISVSIHSDNEASLRLVDDLGFRDTGDLVEEHAPHEGASTAPLRRLSLDAPSTRE